MGRRNWERDDTKKNVSTSTVIRRIESKIAFAERLDESQIDSMMKKEGAGEK